ncbi:MAG: methylenetetrahydrofolate reductase [NAD(P)H] [Solirubrobacterales bacterium]
MKIKELFKEKRVVFSFEIFPPKATSPIQTVYDTIKELSSLNPDYISVTYGAGGNASNNRTCELAGMVKNQYGIESLAHLTCINSKRSDIKDILKDLKANGIENILALRGDLPLNESSKGDFNYANELISYVKCENHFGISAACYPEGHLECRDIAEGIEILKIKKEAGAEHFISQLFFDNNYYYNFVNKAVQKNLNVPIQAGIMPVINKKQIERVVSLCGATIPAKFLKIMNKYEHDELALNDAGIAYALDQIVDLVSSGVHGIHLYTMNNPYVARKIIENTGSIINSLNREISHG